MKYKWTGVYRLDEFPQFVLQVCRVVGAKNSLVEEGLLYVEYDDKFEALRNPLGNRLLRIFVRIELTRNLRG